MPKKILITLAIILVVLIAALASIPLFFKDTIIAKVKTVINENVNAKVNFEELDLGIIRSFPDLSITLNDLMVVGVDSFSTDTLANIKTLQLNLDIMSVIKGETYKINQVNLIQPNIYARVLKSGKANWDIMKADTTTAPIDTTTTTFKAALQKYSIEKGKVIYDDASLDFFLQLDSLDHSGKGDFTQDLFTLETKSAIEKLTVKYAGIPYLNKVKLEAELPLEIDLKQMKFSLGENHIKLNELLLSLVGSLAMPNDNDMLIDVKFNAEKSDLKNFLSLIPTMYASSFKDLDATGKFSFDGKAKGTYNETSLPAFDVNLLIENGKIKYASLPAAINDINVKASINNPDGVINNTVVNIPAFHLAFDKTPVDGRLLVKTPIADPYIDMALKGKLDLKQLTTIFPMKGMSLSGILDVDVQAAGNKSSIDKGQYESFKASGQMLATNFNYSGESVPKPVNISTAKMTFNPKNITLGNLNAKVGKSDFQANGSINNYLSYIFQKNQSLQGVFNLNSNLIDINELMGPETTPAVADTSKLTIIGVPKNIDFKMAVKAGRVLYDTYDISNARGALIVKNETLHFDNMALEILGGKIKMDGSYSTVDIKKPVVDIDFGIEKMSIQKAFQAFNTIKQLAPIAQYTKGEFSTNLKFNSLLGQDMMPIYSSIDASGVANIIEAVLEGFEPLNKLAAGLNANDLKKLELKNIFAKFKIDDGRFSVAPFDIKKGDISMNVQGSNGLDQTLDYNLGLKIPRALLGKAGETANSLLASLNSKTGTSLALGDMVNVKALIGGTVKKPTLKLDLGKNEAKAEVKAIANQIISEKKAELETKLKEEANILKEKAATEVKQKVDTLKKQADQKVKDEVKNQLNKLFKNKE